MGYHTSHCSMHLHCNYFGLFVNIASRTIFWMHRKLVFAFVKYLFLSWCIKLNEKDNFCVNQYVMNHPNHLSTPTTPTTLTSWAPWPPKSTWPLCQFDFDHPDHQNQLDHKVNLTLITLTTKTDTMWIGYMALWGFGAKCRMSDGLGDVYPLDCYDY